MIVNGSLPEISEIKTEGEKISIKGIREIRNKLSLSSVYPYKIIILNILNRFQNIGFCLNQI